jgi:transaldolase
MNPLRQLESLGQSVWLDFITRQFMAEGKLQSLITQDGVSGVTSNPTIFQKAITGGKEYDATISRLIAQGQTAAGIFDAIAIEDIQRACDFFRPVYDATKGADGFVSLEVNPHFARDTSGTLEEVRRLFKAVARPNVMIKIPGTKEGLPAIEQALGEGININITLIFALERYREVINAWLAGLERLQPSGKSLSSVSSVASFFVSRVDSMIDKLLDEKAAKAPEQKASLEALYGKSAIANAQEAYALFEETIASDRFKALAAKGARVQRPLWASTSTKNPKYRDVVYVEELIGRDTVDTMPLATIEAFRDHGKPRASLPAPKGQSQQVLQALERTGVSMTEVTRRLEEEGLKLFAASYDSLIESLEEKKNALKAGAAS